MKVHYTSRRGDDGGASYPQVIHSVHGYPQDIHKQRMTYPQDFHSLLTGYPQVMYWVIHRDLMTETTITEWFKGPATPLSQRFTVTEVTVQSTVQNGSAESV